MPSKPGTESALSEAVSITLILLLMVVIALVVYIVLIGHAGLAPKSAYIALRGTGVNTSVGANTIALFHLEGDAVNLNRSVGGEGIAPVSFNLRMPSGSFQDVRISPLVTDNTWNSGDTITIYEDAYGYWVTDDINARIAASGTIGPLVGMPGGNYTVNVVDLKADLLIAAVPVVITGPGSVEPQYSPGLVAIYYGNTGWTSPSAATTIASRIRYADTSATGSGWGSDISNWPVGYVGKAETFSVIFDGFIKIDTAGDYTFYLTSDDGSTLAIDGTTVVDNGGLHSPQMRQGTIHLAPGYHPITVRMFENTGLAMVHLEQSTPSSPRAFSTQLYHFPSTIPMADFTGVPSAGPADLVVQFTDKSIDATSWSWDFGDGSGGFHAKNPVHTYTTGGKYSVTLVATNAFGSSMVKKNDYISVGTFVPGLQAAYYSDEGWTAPVITNTVNQIHLADQAGVSAGYPSDVTGWPVGYISKAETFSVKFSGIIRIDNADDYTFYLTSDDGSFLEIDDTTVVDNGGLHSPQMQQGTIHLEPGNYAMNVWMYEHTGQAVIYLEYSSPSVGSRKLVTNLWHI